VKRTYALALHRRAQRYWKGSPRYQRISRIDSSLPSSRFLQLTCPLSRQQASLLLQLRTGHVPLNKHLHRIGKAPSPMCPECRVEEESVLHFLLTCPTQTRRRLRAPLENAMGRDARNLGWILTNPKALPHLFKYIQGTRRLSMVFKEVDTVGGRQPGQWAQGYPSSYTPTTPYLFGGKHRKDLAKRVQAYVANG